MTYDDAIDRQRRAAIRRRAAVSAARCIREGAPEIAAGAFRWCAAQNDAPAGPALVIAFERLQHG